MRGITSPRALEVSQLFPACDLTREQCTLQQQGCQNHPGASSARCRTRSASSMGWHRAGGEASGQAVPASTVTRGTLEATCGQAARYLKSYQLVGINFLMFLNSAGVQAPSWPTRWAWARPASSSATWVTPLSYPPNFLAAAYCPCGKQYNISPA